MKRFLPVLFVVALIALVVAPVGATDVMTKNYWSTNEVGVELTVVPIGELWTALRDVNLQIDNASGVISESSRATDTLTSFANVPYEVFVQLSGDLPIYSRFHVLVNPKNDNYNDVNARDGSIRPNEEYLITWDRRINGFAGNQPDQAYFAFAGVPTYNTTQKRVDYVADAIHGLPNDGFKAFKLIWTIAAAQQ